MFDINSCIDAPLVNLGVRNAAFEGIYVPEQELGKNKTGVTKKFLQNAESYHQAYSATAYFEFLLKAALSRIGFTKLDATVLDIGSGSGNSVLPCLNLLPQSHVVATDISEQLLAILLRHINGNIDYQNRVVPICLDATNGTHYRQGGFDLVVGAAILHHLMDPSLAISAAAKALKAGGSAIFFEPFENGNAVLRIAYEEIIRRSNERKRDAASSQALHLLGAMLDDHKIRIGPDKSDPTFSTRDDKWLFTKSYIEDSARAAGFHEVIIYPLHPVEKPFSNQTAVNLKLGAGLPPEALPAWAWDRLHYYDTAFSTELKRDLLIEGAIILRK